MLTPALGADDRYPSLFFWHYFVVLAAVFLVFGLGLTARPRAVGRVFPPAR